MSQQEAIRKIEQVYHVRYNPNLADFDVYEQLLACEAMAETEKEKLIKYGKTNENVNVKWNGNDTCKQKVNFELTQNKLSVIAKLKKCNYLTPPTNIANLLEILFAEWKSNEGWWLCVAQMWNPRAINRTIDYIAKVTLNGTRTIQNPAAYFTFLIKNRHKRKTL